MKRKSMIAVGVLLAAGLALAGCEDGEAGEAVKEPAMVLEDENDGATDDGSGLMAAGEAKAEAEGETLEETENEEAPEEGEEETESEEAPVESEEETESEEAPEESEEEAESEESPEEALEEEPAQTDTEEKSVDASAGVFTKSEITDDIKQRINGISYPAGCTVPYEDLRYLRISYVDYSGTPRVGELICNKSIADDLLDIFSQLYAAGYQICKIRLVDEYGGDDTLSITDDNTSCFNYRVVEGTTKLSKHALGLAIDINPFYNPYVTYPNGGIRISPPGSELYADRSQNFPHKIDKNDLAYKLFKAHGFTWGGDWKTLKDYQHFQKG